MGLLSALNQQKLKNSNESFSGAVLSDTDNTADSREKIEEVVDPYIGYKAELKKQVVAYINDNFSKNSTISKEEYVRKTILDFIIKNEYAIALNDREEVINDVAAEIIGLGPLDRLLRDDNISEIMVNGPYKIYCEEKGILRLTDVKFSDNNHVTEIIDRIVSPLGRHIDESSPMVDARLKDGSRVNVIIPPIALDGPTITIRKFPKGAIRADDLIRFGSTSAVMMKFLEACVKGKLNVIVSGGTGSGKTTLLGALSAFIPNKERILTIEDAAELQLQQEHVVRLEARPANAEGKGRIAIKDLVVNALRMRPDRIIVGECRGGEALDMLQAMNTGHDGSLTTGHANSPRDMINRLETMVMMAGMELPEKAIREQIASAINIIVQQSRLRDGTRKITSITEIIGMEGTEVTTQDIFKFDARGMNENGKIVGDFIATGIRPNCIEKLQTSGVNVKDEWFKTGR